MGDAALTDGEISDDAFDTLKATGDVNEDAQRPLQGVTRKEKKERDAKSEEQKRVGVQNKFKSDRSLLVRVVCMSFSK